MALAAYLAELHDAGRASSSAATVVAAACFRAKLAGESDAGRRANRPGARRLPADRQRSRPGPGAALRGLGPGGRARHLPSPPRRRGRGVESEEVALERGRLDAVIAGLLFMAGMRAQRSERVALGRCRQFDRWGRHAHHCATEQDEPGGRGKRRAVRKGRRGARPPDAARRQESGARRPSGSAVSADDRAAVHGSGADRRC